VVPLDDNVEKKYYQAVGGKMIRLARIMMISVAVFLVAWVIKEMAYQGDAQKADDLIQRIRMSGV
jgi:hypothetical protein